MSKRSVRTIVTANGLGSIYVFMFSMLLSGFLLKAPLIGGALAMCGHCGTIFMASSVGRVHLLGKKQTRFQQIIYLLLLVINLALLFLYPMDVPRINVWILFFVLLSLTFSGGAARQMLRRGPVQKALRLHFILQIILAVSGSALLLFWFPRYIYLTGGYLLAFVLQLYERSGPRNSIPAEVPDLSDAHSAFLKGNVFRLYETASVLITMACYISIILVYCSLALTAEGLFISMAIAFVTNILFAEAADYLLRVQDKRKAIKPDTVIIFSLLLWLCGLVMYSRYILRYEPNLLAVYFGMGMCSAGIAVSVRCLSQMDRVVRQAVLLNAEAAAPQYSTLSFFRNETAAALSEMAALLVITLLFTFNHGAYFQQLSVDRLQPFLLLPAVLLLIAALLTMLRYPATNYYAQKLARLLGLRASGKVNDALTRQVESIFVEERKRPLGTNILKFLFRPFCRHKLSGTENIHEDPDNPLVFLCNHASVYGPLTAVLNIPHPVRPWVVSNIVGTPQEFADYFLENTLGPAKHYPERLKPATALFLGKLSVWCMHQLDSIPVYREKPSQLRQTFRLSSDALESGDNLLIFP